MVGRQEQPETLLPPPPAVIVGGGPSLRSFPWARLLDVPATVIALNRAAEWCVPRYWLAADRDFWLRKARPVPHVATRVWVRTGESEPRVDVALDCAGKDHWDTAWGRSWSEGLGVGGHTGYAAINFAELLGCREVYLLGYDMRGAGGTTAHFHDGYGSAQNERIYERFRETLRVASTLTTCHVTVLDPPGEQASAIDWWERRSWDCLWSLRHTRPVTQTSPIA